MTTEQRSRNIHAQASRQPDLAMRPSTSPATTPSCGCGKAHRQLPTNCSCGTRTPGARAAQPALRRLDPFARIPAVRGRGGARGTCRVSQAGGDRRGSIRAETRLRRRHRPHRAGSGGPAAPLAGALLPALGRHRCDSHRVAQGKLRAGIRGDSDTPHCALQLRRQSRHGLRSSCTASRPIARATYPGGAAQGRTDRRAVPLWHGACHPSTRYRMPARPHKRTPGSNCTA